MRLILSLVALILVLSCRQKAVVPDTTEIKIQLDTFRFERELFSLDSSNFGPSLDKLIARDPNFGENFITKILDIDPKLSNDSVARYINGFVKTYRGIYDTAEHVFSNFAPYQEELRKAMQFCRYYFPEYKLPHKVITYIGPLVGYGDALSEDAFFVGLHIHLGKDRSIYNSSWLNEAYPRYITERFEPGYIVVNCMKNIVLDMYPEKLVDETLLVQMVEKGKRLYVLSKLLPKTEEYKLIGYTEKQMKDCYSHERAIWDLFVQNNFLQISDRNTIKNYIDEGPKTPELGEGAPGNIGSFSGWQIVKKYMEMNPSTTLPKLMAEDPESLFAKAKYKP